jgi:hypothetical protein
MMINAIVNHISHSATCLPALASWTAREIALLDTVLFLWNISSNSCSLRAGDWGSALFFKKMYIILCFCAFLSQATS